MVYRWVPEPAALVGAGAAGGGLEPSLGCASGEGHGEWHFHRWCAGRVGVFLLDLRHNRLWGSRHSPGAAAALQTPLIAGAQWAALREALGAPGLRTLVVCSELPFVDDSTRDASFKATRGMGDANRWANNGAELRRLLHMLFEWETGDADRARRVVLCGGGLSCGVRSSIRNGARELAIEQLVVGPTTLPVEQYACERAGSLGETTEYTHDEFVLAQNVGLLTLRASAAKVELRSELHTVQQWFERGVARALEREPGWIGEIRASAKPEGYVKVARQRIQNQFDKGEQLRDDVRAIHDALEGEVPGFGTRAAETAEALYWPLLGFIRDQAGPNLRGVLTHISPTAVENVVLRWNDETSAAPMLSSESFPQFMVDVCTAQVEIMTKGGA